MDCCAFLVHCAACAPARSRGAVDQLHLAPGASHLVHPEPTAVGSAAVIVPGLANARGLTEAELATHHVSIHLIKTAVAHGAPLVFVVHLKPAMRGAPIRVAHQAH